MNMIVRWVIGVVNPKWMPQAPRGQSIEETLELVWSIFVWRSRLQPVVKFVIPALGLVGTIYAFLA